MTNQHEKVLDLKNRGNECVKTENYFEAVMLYSDAIKINKTNAQLYSNRSFAFLKLQQFYYAIKDAQDAVCLSPDWHKAHFRQAEVEFTTRNYAEALNSYRKAYQIQQDSSLLEYIIKTTKSLEIQQKHDYQIPWIFAGVGLILGVLLIVLDAIFPKNSVFEHPVIQVVVSISLSLCGLMVGRVYKWYSIAQRTSLLEPPADLLNEGNNDKAFEGENETEERKPQSRYSKAQARQRYKKGKS